MSVVNALSQDEAGYLWVGTRSGLIRFDGSQFVTWGTHSEQPLPTDATPSLSRPRRRTAVSGSASCYRRESNRERAAAKSERTTAS
jgi:ligand-binding sensor domain-containing protein